ncbi:hypothetical protein ABZP36_014368 [Zizania latifolia]
MVVLISYGSCSEIMLTRKFVLNPLWIAFGQIPKMCSTGDHIWSNGITGLRLDPGPLDLISLPAKFNICLRSLIWAFGSSSEIGTAHSELFLLPSIGITQASTVFPFL